MTLHSQFLTLLLAAACASQILTSCSPAAAQTPAANTTQQEQNAQPAQVTPEKRPPPTTEGWWAQTTVYESFVFFILGEPETAEEEKLCNCSKVNYSRMLGISKEEEQAMREIMLPVRVRLREIYQEAADARFAPTPWPSEQLAALDNAHDREKKAIIEEMIARLKGRFSNDDFRRLDVYVYETSVQGMFAQGKMRVQTGIAPHTRSAQISNSGPKGSGSSPNPVPTVPQP